MKPLVLAGLVLPLAGMAQAADLWIDQNVHATAPVVGAQVPVPQGWAGSWSWETGQIPTAYMAPAYGYGLPTGYAVMHYDGAPPYCAWITRRTNGYGGRILVWPVAYCGSPR